MQATMSSNMDSYRLVDAPTHGRNWQRSPLWGASRTPSWRRQVTGESMVRITNLMLEGAPVLVEEVCDIVRDGLGVGSRARAAHIYVLIDSSHLVGDSVRDVYPCAEAE